MELLSQLLDCLINGDDENVVNVTRQAIEQNLPPKQILDDALIAGMDIIGQRFKNHEIYLPDVLMAAKAMNAGMDLLKPLLIQKGIPPIGKVVLGSVRGDLHDIGKNLVGIMLKGAGFEVIDLGHDIAPEQFVETAKTENASIIGMSALLTTTMPAMKEVVAIVKEQNLNKQIKTIVGGAPLTQKFADEIGASAYGFDAANAVERVKALIDSSEESSKLSLISRFSRLFSKKQE